MECSIYLLQNKRLPGQYKIGITTNWRKRSIQLEVDTKTTCILVAKVADAKGLERQLHGLFRNERLPQSEWFHLTDSQAQTVISIIRESEELAVGRKCSVPFGLSDQDVLDLLEKRRLETKKREDAIARGAQQALIDQAAQDQQVHKKWQDKPRQTDDEGISGLNDNRLDAEKRQLAATRKQRIRRSLGMILAVALSVKGVSQSVAESQAANNGFLSLLSLIFAFLFSGLYGYVIGWGGGLIISEILIP